MSPACLGPLTLVQRPCHSWQQESVMHICLISEEMAGGQEEQACPRPAVRDTMTAWANRLQPRAEAAGTVDWLSDKSWV